MYRLFSTQGIENQKCRYFSTLNIKFFTLKIQFEIFLQVKVWYKYTKNLVIRQSKKRIFFFVILQTLCDQRKTFVPLNSNLALTEEVKRLRIHHQELSEMYWIRLKIFLFNLKSYSEVILQNFQFLPQIFK